MRKMGNGNSHSQWTPLHRSNIVEKHDDGDDGDGCTVYLSCIAFCILTSVQLLCNVHSRPASLTKYFFIKSANARIFIFHNLSIIHNTFDSRNADWSRPTFGIYNRFSRFCVIRWIAWSEDHFCCSRLCLLLWRLIITRQTDLMQCSRRIKIQPDAKHLCPCSILAHVINAYTASADN